MDYIWRFVTSPLGLTTGGIALATGGVVYYKDHKSCNYKPEKLMKDTTAVVTGATSGIGLATALALAEAGARVIMACRDTDRCREERRKIVLKTRNKRVVCYECDLASLESVKRFAEKVLVREPKVNLLINNAGVMYVPPRPTTDGFERHLAVNFLGHFLLTSLLFEKLKASAPSRIINVADMAYKRGHINFDDLNGFADYDKKAAYNRSKLASVAFTKELSRRAAGSSVTVNDVFPGYTESELGREMKSRAVQIITKPLKWLALQKPEKAANTLMYAVTAPELATVSGKFLRYDRASRKCIEEETVGEVNDPKVPLWLWLTAEKWTKASEAKTELTKMVEEEIKVLAKKAKL